MIQLSFLMPRHSDQDVAELEIHLIRRVGSGNCSTNDPVADLGLVAREPEKDISLRVSRAVMFTYTRFLPMTLYPS